MPGSKPDVDNGAKVKVSGVQQFATCLTDTGTHIPYEITECYLPPGRGDITRPYSIKRPRRDAMLS